MSDDLLVKYLTGEVHESEYAEVEEWLQASEENKNYYEHFVVIWEESLRLSAKSSPDENIAWQKFQKHVQQESREKKPSVPLTNMLFRVAAALILFAGLGWIVYQMSSSNMQPITTINIAAKDEVVTDTLPDGSLITANKNSTFSYPSQFTGDTREVFLKGEAFFNVAPNKEKPFIIHVNDIAVKVVGTSFNIRSVNGKTEVIVETGIVEVMRKKQRVQLKPKQKVIVKAADSVFVKDSVNDQLYNYYRKKEFICNNTPLYRLVETLNEAYNANVVIENNNIRNLPITTIFKEEPLDNVLTVISETLDIKVEKQQNVVILR